MKSSRLSTQFIVGIALTLLIGTYGCSYTVPTRISPAVNVYSSYEDKIPGKLMLIVDKSCSEFSIDLKPSSYICGAHTFPVKLDTILSTSIRQTSESIFEEVVEQMSLPSPEQMRQANVAGVLFVRLNRFSPSLRFSPGFWEGSASASCDVVLDVTVKDALNINLVTTAVGGSRSSDGSAGSACSGGADVLSDAISKSIQDTMERFAERISNSQKIRTSFAAKNKPSVQAGPPETSSVQQNAAPQPATKEK